MAIILIFLASFGSAHLANRRPADLGLTLAPCGANRCVAWVMPAGFGWHRGARPGMLVLSASIPTGALQRLLLETPNGWPFVVEAGPGAWVAPEAELSFGLVGLAFALLGAAVLVRRPGAPAARLFAVFAAFAAVALGVAPAAGGPHPAWALSAQFVSILALGATLPAFAMAFVENWSGRDVALRGFTLAGGVILAGYLYAVGFSPSAYPLIRVAFGSFLTVAILAALVILARRAFAPASHPAVREVRIALGGIACGTLPFVTLTLIPIVTGHRELAPWYVTAPLTGLIPASFAYAILRHHVLGIRRLVHRGMVYGITSLVLLGAVALAASIGEGALAGTAPSLLTATLVVAGALLFDVLRRAVRRIIDRRIYHDEVDSQALLADMRHDLLGSGGDQKPAEVIVGRLQHALDLESAVLFLGTNAAGSSVTATAGARSAACIDFIHPRLGDLRFGVDGLTDVWWDSDILVVTTLQSSGESLGWLVLGPKAKGEVLVHEERHLIATVAPILALAIRETTLLAELRELSRRLIDAEESERARIARDLHDGPLQKAILLGGLDRTEVRDRDGIAGALVAEIRELCARLRPAILDDLGLVAAVDWLLEQASRQFAVRPRLTLRGMTEDDRLAPETEVALFRVTQEAVTNAVRHGHAKSIKVSLARTDDRLELCICDDGRGFASADGIPRGLGIPGMRERMRQIGGGVTIASDRGAGTKVKAFIPNPGRGAA